jgi:hypothetical protein
VKRAFISTPTPEVAEQIVTGDEPVGISLSKLRNNLPAVWEEQVWG